MNNPGTEFFEDNANGSDSDVNPEECPEYYQPISTRDDGVLSDGTDSDGDSELHRLPNGYSCCVENGISSLDLSDKEEPQGDEEEEEEERMREASDWAMLRAFREDESRRNAPLTPENAVRVMEAMRGISFRGLAPDWAARVSDEQWINQLRRLRPPATTSQD